jgi:hypothetical protein
MTELSQVIEHQAGKHAITCGLFQQAPSKQFFTGGGTVRDWLTGQSFADQYEFGTDVLGRIQNGLPLP